MGLPGHSLTLAFCLLLCSQAGAPVSAIDYAAEIIPLLGRQQVLADPMLPAVDFAAVAVPGRIISISQTWQGEVDTTGSIVRSTDDHLVVTLGLQDCIVIHTPDATLVADKNDESAIKKVVEQLEALGKEEYL